ncbi:hypothetical protein G6549_26845 [Bacillus sp. MM2020_1]|nr:hypothetical protein [Bacillus sp. MM2020_1]
MTTEATYDILAARQQSGMTLEDIAYFLRVTPEEYKAFEDYKVVMTDQQALDFSKLVKLPMEQILFNTPVLNIKEHTKKNIISYHLIAYCEEWENPYVNCLFLNFKDLMSFVNGYEMIVYQIKGLTADEWRKFISQSAKEDQD